VLFSLLACLAGCSGAPIDVGPSTGGGAGGGAGGGTAASDGGHSDAGGTAAGADGGASDGGAGADAGLDDGGASIDGGLDDGGSLDAGPLLDGGAQDAGATDGGELDGGPADGGDAGLSDGGRSDAGVSDAGSADAGLPDAGPTDCVGATRVLFEQVPHGPQGQLTYANPEDGGYARWADDFTVPLADGCWCVEAITAGGFPSMTSPPPAGTTWRIAFFENATGAGAYNVPGAQTTTMDLLPSTLTDAKAEFTLPAVLKLGPGLRWLSVAGRTKSTVISKAISGPAWAWFNSASPHLAGGNSASFIDSGGLLPGNEGTWFSGQWLGGGLNDVDLAFQLHGRTAAACQ
jgi:hypothetical protein